jgi:nucleoside-diphosphate-sugar epimerase
MLDVLGRLLDTEVSIEHGDPRPGDIRLSQADARAAARDLGWRPAVSFEDGMRRTVEWFSR